MDLPRKAKSWEMRGALLNLFEKFAHLQLAIVVKKLLTVCGMIPRSVERPLLGIISHLSSGFGLVSCFTWAERVRRTPQYMELAVRRQEGRMGREISRLTGLFPVEPFGKIARLNGLFRYSN